MRKFLLLFVLLTSGLFACKPVSEPNAEDEPAPQPQDSMAVRGYITAKYHDWVWENGEQPSLEVYVVNPNKFDMVVPLKLTINTCNVLKTELVDTVTKMVHVKAGDSMAVYISPSKNLTPEIYRASIKLDNKSLKTVMLNWDGEHKISKFNIAVDPMKIESPYDGQPDFEIDGELVWLQNGRDDELNLIYCRQIVRSSVV